MSMSDETILQLAARPETREDAFRALVAAHQQRLYAVIRQRVGAHGEADDILQNTFLKVFRYLHTFEGRSGLFTWMYRIAVNEAANYHAARKRRPVADTDAMLQEAQADAYVDGDRISAQLEEAVRALPEQQQRVFRMRYYDALTYKEMAGLLHLTEGALKASFHHAVRKVEAFLKARQVY
jgi:RNA polymerase sigma-70 factor (ECF subfamily)